ncbi:hypothetical protein JHK87_024538 [Glycine soja]|nr:hypothetical protein JHK87_024538 [Glycine soja]
MGMERTPQRRITIILARRMSCSFAAPPPPLPELRWTHPQSKLNIKATQRSQDLKKILSARMVVTEFASTINDIQPKVQRLYLQLSFIDFYSGRKMYNEKIMNLLNLNQRSLQIKEEVITSPLLINLSHPLSPSVF